MNLHATSDSGRPDVPRTELDRARAFAEAVARPGDRVVIAGDFNLSHPKVWGYSEGTDAIDHILVRGAGASLAVTWPVERRVHKGVVLSDHAPVELTLP
jgi:endonuclease/exonuclease/phosphatase family metal-dependent hydrolase